MSNAATKRRLIQELLNAERMPELLRDSFANYVLQTALDSAESNVFVVVWFLVATHRLPLTSFPVIRNDQATLGSIEEYTSRKALLQQVVS